MIKAARTPEGQTFLDQAKEARKRPPEPTVEVEKAVQVLRGENYGWIDGEYFDCIEEEYARRIRALLGT